MTNDEKLHKEELIKKLDRLSNHYALSDEQSSIIKDAAEIIDKDIKEIVGLMAMSRGMMKELGEQRVGEIFRQVFGRYFYIYLSMLLMINHVVIVEK